MVYPEKQRKPVDAPELLMAKKKRKTFDVVKAVKSASRAAIGTVPPTRRAETNPKKRPKAGKHKPTLGELLGEE